MVTIQELYESIKSNYYDLKLLKKHLLEEIRNLKKKVAEKDSIIADLQEENQLLNTLANTKQVVTKKTHEKLQKRFAELNTYCRSLEARLVNEKELRL